MRVGGIFQGHPVVAQEPNDSAGRLCRLGLQHHVGGRLCAAWYNPHIRQTGRPANAVTCLSFPDSGNGFEMWLHKSQIRCAIACRCGVKQHLSQSFETMRLGCKASVGGRSAHHPWASGPTILTRPAVPWYILYRLTRLNSLVAQIWTTSALHDDRHPSTPHQPGDAVNRPVSVKSAQSIPASSCQCLDHLTP